MKAKNHEHIAELFAQGEGKSHYCGNMNCEENVMYSYGYHEIARIFPEERTAVINCCYYSRSTAAHTSGTEDQLIEAGYKILPVYTENSEIVSERTISDTESEVARMVGKVQRARTKKHYYKKKAIAYREAVKFLRNKAREV